MLFQYCKLTFFFVKLYWFKEKKDQLLKIKKSEDRLEFIEQCKGSEFLASVIGKKNAAKSLGTPTKKEGSSGSDVRFSKNEVRNLQGWLQVKNTIL